MKKTIEISVPEGWHDVSLKQYLELMHELENYKDDEEASAAILLWKLCGVDGECLQTLPQETFMRLKGALSEFINKTECPLQRIIEVGGKYYGFETDLSRMAYGAYADITRWDVISIDKNWSSIMDILYRPVTNRKGELYNIEPYTGKPAGVDWSAVGMDVHFGTLFFFVNLSMDLAKDTQNSLMEMVGMGTDYPQTSLVSGEPMEQSLNLQVEMLRKLMRLHNNL